MDARNLPGRMELAWTHGICMDAWNLQGLREFSWKHRIFMDALLNLHTGVVKLVGGGSVIIRAYPV